MKKLYYTTLSLLFCTSCINRPKEAVISEKLINEFKPIIQGVWDNKKEMEEISSGDPKARDTSADCISVMEIETKEIIGTTLMVHVGLCNGQGTDMMLKFDPGKHTRAIILGDHYELACRTINGDTTLIVYSTDKENPKAYEFIKTLNYFPRPQ